MEWKGNSLDYFIKRFPDYFPKSNDVINAIEFRVYFTSHNTSFYEIRYLTDQSFDLPLHFNNIGSLRNLGIKV